jgi:hypothetical protein
MNENVLSQQALRLINIIMVSDKTLKSSQINIKIISD